MLLDDEDHPMWIVRVLSILALLGSVLPLAAEEPAWKHPNTSEPGWQDLFQADLSDAIQSGSAWTFNEGILTASADEVLWTKREFGDCVIDLEFKTEPGTNSGVIVYASDTANWIPNSVEVQITDDFSEEWSRAPKTWQCGAIFGHLAPRESRVKHPGEWNRYTIFCEGHNLRVVLNDGLVTELDMSKWTDARHNPDGSEIPEWLSRPMAELATRGRIGLQGKHAEAPIWFRHLRIKVPPSRD
ncbi:MAG TPA: DUF1080 domain-containing protein [Pirellulaceae bacterium]